MVNYASYICTTCLMSTYYFASNSANAALMPFLPLFYRAVGLNAFLMGLLYASYKTSTIFGTIFWPSLCRVYCSARSNILVSIMITLVLYMIMTTVPLKFDPIKTQFYPQCIQSENSISLHNLLKNFFHSNASIPFNNTTQKINVEKDLSDLLRDVEFSNLNDSVVNTEWQSYYDKFMNKLNTDQKNSIKNLNISQDDWKLMSDKDYTYLYNTLDDLDKQMQSKPLKRNRRNLFDIKRKEGNYKMKKQKKNNPRYNFFNIDEFIDEPNVHSYKGKKHKHAKKIAQNEIKNDQIITQPTTQPTTTTTTTTPMKIEKKTTIIMKTEIEKTKAMDTTLKLKIIKDAENLNENYLMGSVLSVFKKRLDKIHQKIYSSPKHSFVLMLVILILVGLLSPPHNRVVDNAWFEYLDTIEMSESFSNHKIWKLLGYAVVPFITVLIVIASSKCNVISFWYPTMNLSSTPQFETFPYFYINASERVSSKYLLHFYLYAGFMILSIPLVFLLNPMKRSYSELSSAPSKKTKMYKSNVYEHLPISDEDSHIIPPHTPILVNRGLRMCFGSMTAAVYTITFFIFEMIKSLEQLFLFWSLVDVGGNGLHFSLFISVASVSQILFSIILSRKFNTKILKRKIIFIVVLISMIQCVVYSFSFNPWYILIGATLSAFGRPLFKDTLEKLDEFVVINWQMDRSVDLVLRGLIAPFGYALGAMMFGYFYEKLGISILFQATTGVLGLWLIFLIVFEIINHKCSCTKKKSSKYKYTKLLNSSSKNDGVSINSDESEVCDDEWLESMKGIKNN
ncbi:Major facilitator superfamily domain-containing protein 6-like protein [Intoshia linei]|uniref:Major facilitator superfamily domain-containing protein 6-like protein n=1 Tax=Intoshia linei TaxID=1819745 RepID=A0A177B7X1_9BILA|nr:Major facilitator superfamily domain-containing protein 6-like protein [Intoshia linei]